MSDRVPAARADAVAAPTAADFREVVSRFPSGVVVISTRHHDVDYAMTASSFTSVSLDPLLVLICIRKDSAFHSAILESESWAVNVLPHDGGEIADWCARHGRPLPADVMTRPDLTEKATLRRSSSGLLLLEEAVAHLECTTDMIHSAGDHDIVIGEVHAGRVKSREAPLIYWASKYHHGPVV